MKAERQYKKSQKAEPIQSERERSHLSFEDNRPQTASQTKLIHFIQKKENKIKLSDDLKTDVRNLSSFSMDDVYVHYDSGNPAQLNVWAYTQGTDIHVAPGQEMNIDDNKKLEKQADNKSLNSKQYTSRLYEQTFEPFTIQRVIDYTIKPKSGPSFPNKQELQTFLTNHYGEDKSEFIRELIDHTEADSKTFTLDDVYTWLERHLSIHIPITASKTRDPSTSLLTSSFQQMAFTSKTRLSCVGSEVYINLTNSGDGHLETHAERLLIQQLSTIHLPRELTITINNSPCEYCAEALSKFAKEHPDCIITVRYCNPYGDKEMLLKSIKLMRDAGIRIHSFDLVELEGLTPEYSFKGDYHSRAESMSRRLYCARQIEDYESDDEKDIRVYAPIYTDDSMREFIRAILSNSSVKTHVDTYFGRDRLEYLESKPYEMTTIEYSKLMQYR